MSTRFHWFLKKPDQKFKTYNLLINVTYHQAKIEQEINQLVGKQFSLFESIKLNGTGSGRLVIKDASEDILKLINKSVDTAYTNIELRPKGIIVGIKSIHETYYWVIPYYLLTIYKNDGHISVYDGKYKMNLIYDSKGKPIMKFLSKVMEMKSLNTGGPI